MQEATFWNVKHRLKFFSKLFGSVGSIKSIMLYVWFFIYAINHEKSGQNNIFLIHLAIVPKAQNIKIQSLIIKSIKKADNYDDIFEFFVVINIAILFNLMMMKVRISFIWFSIFYFIHNYFSHMEKTKIKIFISKWIIYAMTISGMLMNWWIIRKLLNVFN